MDQTYGLGLLLKCLADRTNGRTHATVLHPVCLSSVIVISYNIMHCG